MSETPITDRAGEAEQLRLQQSRIPGTPWKLWGPYSVPRSGTQQKMSPSRG